LSAPESKKEPIMRCWKAIFVVCLVALPAAAAPPEGEQPRPLAKLRKAKVDAARQTLDIVMKNYKDGNLPVVELPYRWSCRLVEAERQLNLPKTDRIASAQAHLERMRDVERIARERFRIRIISIDETKAAEFYRLEAEIWLAEARE
jgi:hypothetical protein